MTINSRAIERQAQFRSTSPRRGGDRRVDRADGRDQQTPDRRRTTLVIVGLVAALLIASTAAVSIGSVSLAPLDVWSVIAAHVGLNVEARAPSTDTIVWVVRTPRVLLAAVVGAGLATAGAVLQAAVRNPIADPFLLGISSGASVGAIAVVVFGVGAALGPLALSAGAFLAALVVAAIVLLVASRHQMTPLRIILAGVAVSYGASALASFLLYRAPNADAVRTVIFWLLGSLAGATWAKVIWTAVLVLPGIVMLWLLGRQVDGLLAGDDTAATLGIDVERVRRILVVATSLITAAVVAVSGVIGFVGLLLPHAARFLIGNGHRRLLPVTALLGALFLVLVDLAARTIASPQEIPVGILTAGVGAPFFLWVLSRQGKRIENGQ